MRFKSGLLLFVCLSASAQISNLRTDATGSAVYFSTSARIIGSDQFDWPKLFVLNGQGPRLYEQRQPESAAILTDPFRLERVEFGGNARMLVGSGFCNSAGISCPHINMFTTEVALGGRLFRAAGQGQLSADGHYLLTCCGNGFPPLPVLRSDLTTGKQDTLGQNPVGGGRWIASNGNALAIPNKDLKLFHADGTQAASGLPDPRWASLSDDGSAVALVDADGGLWLWREAGDARALGLRGSSPALSPDARRLAFIGEDHQLQVCDTSLCLPMAWTDVPEGIVEFTWSGDGHVLFAAGKWGRVLRIDLDGYTVAEWMEGMPQTTSPVGLLSPGSTYALPGWFATGDMPTYLRIGNDWVRTLDVRHDQLVVQVPWGLPPAIGPVYVVAPHPFELKISDGVAAIQPRLAAAIHVDFHGLISNDDPARQGEVIHLYLEGMGAPLVTLADREPAPVDRTIGLVLPWQFQTDIGATNGYTPLETLFVGMAPGLVGFYQADVRLPSYGPDPFMGLYCTSPPGLMVFLLGQIPVK